MLVKHKPTSLTTRAKSKMENKQQTPAQTVRKRRKSSKFNDTMTIQEYIAAVEQWKKDGDDLQKVGEKFQTVMGELRQRSNQLQPVMKVPQQQYNSVVYPNSIPSPNFQASQPQTTSPDMGVGSFENTQHVSMISPEQHLADLQNTISEQVRQANLVRNKSEQPDPF